ncbi:MAG: helix-turn-helix domain-containing protein [Candidatus Bathyarchaeia archaeon]
MSQVTVAKAATDLNIRPQKIYKWIREGKIEGKKVNKKTCVDPDAVKAVLEEELKHPQAAKGGRHLNWQALIDFLKETGPCQLEVAKIREIVEAPKAKLEMLHYWDPYRAQAKFGNQGPGLKAIRAAGLELARIEFDYVDGFDLLGAVSIEVRKK